MGNAMFHCMLRPVLTVRLIQPNGEVLEFDRQVMAKQLMKLYHGHLVVHCSRLSRAEGGPRSVGLQEARVTLLRPEKMLQLGQTYCLLRVPSPGTHLESGENLRVPSAGGKSVQRQICGREVKRVTLRGLIYGTASDVCVYERDIVGQLQRQFAHAIQLTFGPTYASTTGAALAKDSCQPTRLLARPERQAKVPASCSKASYASSWRPQLESIMESPLITCTDLPHLDVQRGDRSVTSDVPEAECDGMLLADEGRNSEVVHELGCS